jgi:hypothetical protein
VAARREAHRANAVWVDLPLRGLLAYLAHRLYGVLKL